MHNIDDATGTVTVRFKKNANGGNLSPSRIDASREEFTFLSMRNEKKIDDNGRVTTGMGGRIRELPRVASSKAKTSVSRLKKTEQRAPGLKTGEPNGHSYRGAAKVVKVCYSGHVLGAGFSWSTLLGQIGMIGGAKQSTRKKKAQ